MCQKNLSRPGPFPGNFFSREQLALENNLFKSLALQVLPKRLAFLKKFRRSVEIVQDHQRLQKYVSLRWLGGFQDDDLGGNVGENRHKLTPNQLTLRRCPWSLG